MPSGTNLKIFNASDAQVPSQLQKTAQILQNLTAGWEAARHRDTQPGSYKNLPGILCGNGNQPEIN